MRNDPLPPEQHHAYALGLLYTEQNTILRRIRFRRSGEPTTAERNRLAQLRQQIAAHKRGEYTCDG